MHGYRHPKIFGVAPRSGRGQAVDRISVCLTLKIAEGLDSDDCAEDGIGFFIPQYETFENLPSFVIPAKAGIHKTLKGLDSCFRRNDDLLGFGRNSKVSI